MQIIRTLASLPAAARGGAVSIGNFDGVHRGHVAIVQRLLERAEAVGGPAIVFTFDPHPVQLLRPEQCPPPLTWTERKAELLAAQGVDWIVAYPTDEALLQLSAAEFFAHICAAHWPPAPWSRVRTFISDTIERARSTALPS